MSAFQDEFLNTIKQILPQLELRYVIHAAYISASLGASFPELIKKLKTDLAKNLVQANANASINDLATAAVVISTVVKDSDADKATLLRDLGNY